MFGYLRSAALTQACAAALLAGVSFCVFYRIYLNINVNILQQSS
jgi:hypothetical protein